jgi:hypothetical protein
LSENVSGPETKQGYKVSVSEAKNLQFARGARQSAGVTKQILEQFHGYDVPSVTIFRRSAGDGQLS